ncbi:hypothetical protein [Amycolatopsis vastitatis]|uniref:DUF1877 domain-containing protein n=1 Tax=Amycolatopsis vastitatis TaxID=1905142 RepID=A0A229SQ09_9PSEU|nr:hypothetical protein [Amycolatopsis vastitatis]OXM60912.1 hypothetical protein CF165_40770 [Amycolatopsis vastitatis]
MSSIIEFFVAPDDAAAAGVVQNGPGAGFEPAAYGNFDVWSTLGEWESILTGRGLEEPIAGGGPDVVAGGDGSPVVLAVPRDLTRALAGAGRHLLGTTAERWVERREEDGETIDDELARQLLGEVAALAAGAAGTGRSLYCWIC